MSFKVHFVAGTYWRYQFDAVGNVTASKSYTLSKSSNASADLRQPIPNRPGIWLHMMNGIFSGYWMHESVITDVTVVPEVKIADIVVQPPAPPVTPPPVVPPPVTGIPSPPAGTGTLLRWEGKNGTLAPFKVLTYPDDHIGGSGQYMTQFCRYRNHVTPSHPLVHDGFMDLWAVRRPDGLWDADLVGTSQAGNGPTYGYGIYRFWARFNPGPGTWQCCWLYDTTTWTADEIDWPEMLENLRQVAHVLGTGAGSAASGSPPADIASTFHEYKIERRASFTAFSIDGVEKGRVTSTQSTKKLAVLLDSKVGFGWMGSTGQITSATPSPTFLQVAAVTIDP